MTNEEAKFILGAYRPGGRDATEPTMTAALDQARRDPALARWFEREQAHAKAVAEKLRAIAPPAGLRDAILAGARASESAAAVIVRWKQPVWLAAAAAVVLVFALGLAMWPKADGVTTEAFANFAIRDTATALDQHGGHGLATTALQTALSEPTTRLAGELPLNFVALKATGCRTLRFGGHEVLEVCFNREGGEFHLFVMAADKSSPTAESKAGTFFAAAEGLNGAAWSKGAYRFAVASRSNLDVVKRLL